MFSLELEMHESSKATQASNSLRSGKSPFVPGKVFVNFSPICRFYPAARAESVLESKGTRAWMVEPAFGCELIESSPPTNRSRSCMLVRPSPVLFIAVSVSKPAVELYLTCRLPGFAVLGTVSKLGGGTLLEG
jgi:hypothetical protein